MPELATAALAAAVADADPQVPGVTGPDVVVRAFASALPGARRLEVTMHDVVLVLGTLVEPVGVPGEVVVAQPDEMTALLAWHEQFAIDAGLPMHDMESSIRSRLDAAALLWWNVDGEHVSLAGHTQPVAVPGGSVGRIGPVFTPHQHRRHGYASALTAAVVRRMLPGCSTVMLFADTANPTSNGVYERLGFRPVAEVVEARLVPG
jgi:predicted GNAT family acetyltransferase